MPRVTFAIDFDHKVKPNVITAYKAGSTYLVSQACAAAAKARAAVVEKTVKVEENASG